MRQRRLGSFTQFSYRIIDHSVILPVSFQAARAPFAATVHLLDRYSIGLERMVRLVQTAQFGQ